MKLKNVRLKEKDLHPGRLVYVADPSSCRVIVYEIVNPRVEWHPHIYASLLGTNSGFHGVLAAMLEDGKGLSYSSLGDASARPVKLSTMGIKAGKVSALERRAFRNRRQAERYLDRFRVDDPQAGKYPDLRFLDVQNLLDDPAVRTFYIYAKPEITPADLAEPECACCSATFELMNDHPVTVKLHDCTCK